ncbi:hypothetical protein B0H14DRAFT_2747577 [Mycena olivaceomarginata]|nr:hypothetical protein B0H14DRAFT_2747577 [Mycena olivaceomarginata]
MRPLLLLSSARLQALAAGRPQTSSKMGSQLPNPATALVLGAWQEFGVLQCPFALVAGDIQDHVEEFTGSCYRCVLVSNFTARHPSFYPSLVLVPSLPGVLPIYILVSFFGA